MSNPDELISEIIRREGGLTFTNHPEDSGGPTKAGITLATLEAWRGEPVTAADVEALEESEIRQIYLQEYWIKPGFATVAVSSQTLAEELMDTGVNMGPATAVRFLQRFLTAFNDRGRHYDDLEVDGVLGPVTLASLNAYLSHRQDDNGEGVLLYCMDAAQAVHYIEIAERREADEVFVYGQILRRSAENWIA